MFIENNCESSINVPIDINIKSIRDLLYTMRDETFCYFRDRDKEWEYLAIGEKKVLPNSKKEIVFGALPFSKEETPIEFEPRFYFKKEKEKVSLYLNDKLSKKEFSAYFDFKKNNEVETLLVNKKNIRPDKQEWFEIISKAQEKLNNNLNKVVLSRKILYLWL